MYTPDACGELVRQIQTKTGSSTLLQTVTKTYTPLYDPYAYDLNQSVSDIGLPQSTATKWQNGETNNVQLTYDPGFSYSDYNYTGSCGFANICNSVYGLVTSQAQSDYNTNTPGSTIFATNTSYLALSNMYYLWANILSLPSSQTVTDANNNLCSKTDYGYDASSYIDAYPGALQNHPGAPTAGVFGDLTSVTQKLLATHVKRPLPLHR